MNRRDLLRLARAIAAHDSSTAPRDDIWCVGCSAFLSGEPDLDPTALCNLCAQDFAEAAAHALLDVVKPRHTTVKKKPRIRGPLPKGLRVINRFRARMTRSASARR